MSAMAIDTLKFVKELEKAGFSRQQAEAQATALNAALSESIATKQDLKALELRLKYDLTIRLGGIVVACTALLLAALPLLIK